MTTTSVSTAKRTHTLGSQSRGVMKLVKQHLHEISDFITCCMAPTLYPRAELNAAGFWTWCETPLQGGGTISRGRAHGSFLFNYCCIILGKLLY